MSSKFYGKNFPGILKCLHGGVKMKKILSSAILSMSILFTTNFATAADISLPQPNILNSKMLVELLNERKSVREYFDKALTREQLSQILWAANGITKRYDGTGHVNPAAMGIYAVDVYAVTADGIYLYLPEKHSLKLVAKGDFRATTTTGQEFVKNAPLNLVYVENILAWKKSPHQMPRQNQIACANIAAGAMSQSVALAAGAEDLGNCVRGSIDEKAFKQAAKLSFNQKIILAQTVGDSPNVPKG